MVKKENYVVKIGPLLKNTLDKQKENVKRETYDVCNTSDYEAGEILAKKIIENKLI